MEIQFKDKRLARLDTEAGFNAGFAPDVVRKFRMRMQLIRAALDERDFRNMNSLRFKKMKADRAHQYEMRLNDQWRLILEISTESSGEKLIVIVGIEDVH